MLGSSTEGRDNIKLYYYVCARITFGNAMSEVRTF